MKRVLMISPHFPPDTSAGTHRVRLLAPHLPACGWDPTVVTVEASAYEGRLDPDLAALVPPSVRVVRVGALPASMTRRIGLGDLGLRALPGLMRTCGALLRQERFDALFVTIYPTYPALLGPPLKRRHGVPFVLDYQDPWVGAWGRDVGGGPGGRPDLKSRLTRALATRLEPIAVRAVDGLTAVSARTYEDVLRRVPEAHPAACAAIPIGFDAADLAALTNTPRANKWFTPGDGFTHVCYVGTILPTGIAVLRTVLAAVARLRECAPAAYGRLRLHFLGTSNQRTDAPPRVLPIAAALGVGDVVREVPARLDYLDALNVQVQADALLLMGSTEPHYTASKIFPALLSGRPLLAVYHSASSVVDIMSGRTSATVLSFGTEAELAALAPQVAASLERLVATAGGTARQIDLTVAADPRIRPWSAESLAGDLARVLDAVA